MQSRTGPLSGTRPRASVGWGHLDHAIRWNGAPLGRLVRTLGSVCADGALGAVPVAHRAALCAGQPFRRRQGTRSRLAARTGYGARLYRGEWLLLRAIADGLEWSYGWSEPAAQRLRFMLDFGYATGLRASELVGAVLGNVRLDEHGDHWLHLVGKGGKPGKVALPPLAYTALDQYLAQRQLPVSRERWNPKTPWWAVLGKTVMPASPALTFGACCEDSLRKPLRPLRPIIRSPPKAAPCHASLDASQSCQPCVGPGAQLTAVRDNLRHASIATTSMYLHGDELERARQMRQAFGARHVKRGVD